MIRVPLKITIEKVTIEPEYQAGRATGAANATIEGKLGNRLGNMPVKAKMQLSDQMWAVLQGELLMAAEDDIAENTSGTVLGRHLQVVTSDTDVA